MDSKILELPNSWARVKLGDFVENEKGKKPKNESKTETAVHFLPYVDIQAFEENVIRTWTDGIGCRLCYDTDFLMVWDGSRSGLVGKGINGALGSTLVRIYFPSMVNDYAYYFLQSKYQQINTRAKGVGIPHVDPNLLWNYDFPIPPLNEQHRIVAKIEKLFSELDKGIENMKTARAQIKVYRQALLKHAFEGKLTSVSSDAAWPQKALGDLLDFLTSGSRGWAQYYTAEGDLFIRAQNIKHDLLELDDIAFVSLPERTEGLRARVKKGDLLITITGANVTKSALVERDVGTAYVSQHVALCRPTTEVFPRFLYWFIVAEAAGRKQLSDMAYGAGKPGLNLENIRSVRVPLPKLPEQQRIVELIEGKLSEVDQLELTITTSLQQAEALRQSILKKAFSGQLVAQDANDEPASVLLARIKEGKTAQATTTKPRKPQKTQSQPASAKTNALPFPIKIGNISATDLHAGILARAYWLHEQEPKHLAYFGHVKAEKVAHLVETHLGIDLERLPVKDAAGPNDYPHLKKVESRARKANWFDVHQKKDGRAYVFTKGHGFDALLGKTTQALGDRATAVDELIKLLLPLNSRQAEIVATLYAAWNNLLLLGHSPSNEDIVYEARENWHESKLEIEREKFFKGLEWMRQQGLVPMGRGQYVAKKGKQSKSDEVKHD